MVVNMAVFPIYAATKFEKFLEILMGLARV